MTGTLPDLAPDLRAVLERHADRLDLELIERALRFSASAHRGQKRMSGEDFVSHSIAVALILAEQLLDSATIAAALTSIRAICAAWLRTEEKPIVFDVGANVGFVATQLAQMLNGRSPTIYAFEPVPATFAKLVLDLYARGDTNAAETELQEYLRLAPDAPDRAYVEQELRKLSRT